MKLYIKYMVSLRCKMFVKSELENIGIKYSSVELGSVDIQDDVTTAQLETFNKALAKGGLELLDNKSKF
ncbi:MAG: hypothetical protein U5K71_16940, partial [Gracilimonas sp.]|nr:hypothetical protein [Gracilimonas sp.]